MNQNAANTENVQDTVRHSKPIPISTHHLRPCSPSSYSDSSNSPTSSPPLVTPNFSTRIQASSSSPIFHFLSQSPSKAPSTFPFRTFPPPPLLEDESTEELASSHARRGSFNTIGRFQPQPPVPETHHERGVNVLRRLSLSGHRGRTDIPQPNNPQPPPDPAVSTAPNTNNISPNRKFRRSATITGQTRPHRAPSPMGERILKGHFDGFI